MRTGLTKDALAVLFTSIFLLWVVATFFAPILFHTYIPPQGWMTLAALDALAAVSCSLGYVLIGARLPA